MESFNGKLRDELLDREIFYTLPGGPGPVIRYCAAGDLTAQKMDRRQKQKYLITRQSIEKKID